MLENKTIAVVVPAYNEAKQIKMVIETIPKFVDRIIIVNDNSEDETENQVKCYLKTDYNKTSMQIRKKVIKRSLYNEADLILQELNLKELGFFSPSKIINKNP